MPEPCPPGDRWALGLLLTLLVSCASPAAPEHGAWTLPDDDHWVLRWRGAPTVRVDGQPVDPAAGVARISADRPHRVTVGERTFTMAPRPTDPCGQVRFVALGDGRASVDGVGPSAYWPAMIAEAVRTRPLFIVNTGDLVKRGRDPAEWARYFAATPPWPPMVAVRGNHDRGGLYERYHAGVGPLWTWAVGPVWFVAIDTEGTDAELEVQLAGLDAALRRGGDRWKVVFLHRPVWSRGNHGSDERGVNARLVPILDRNGVDLVLAGHDHDYERFCPSKGVGPDRCAEGGTTYIVTGGAATFTVPVPGVAWKVSSAQKAADARASRVFSGSKHFIAFEVSADRLVGTVHRTRVGNVRPQGVIDRFELRRPAPEGCVSPARTGP